MGLLVPFLSCVHGSWMGVVYDMYFVVLVISIVVYIDLLLVEL